jgi:hypothetical protein
MSDDVLASLMAMADTADTLEGKASKPKKRPAIAESTERAEKTEKAPVSAPAKAEKSTGRTVPVVVLDDGSTFSDVGGAKVCFVAPGSEEITADAYETGISIADLLVLREAIRSAIR